MGQPLGVRVSLPALDFYTVICYTTSMGNIINNRIKNGLILALSILTILVLGTVVFMPGEIKAATGKNVTYGNKNVSYDDNSYITNASVGVNNIYTSGTTGAVLGASTSAPATNSSADTSKDIKEEFKDLTANAIYGTDSFMPSGLIQWLILAIFILIIIILARKFFGLEDKYHATPLKQS